MIELDKEKVLELYPEFDRVYSGYKEKKDGRKIISLYSTKTKESRNIHYARLVLECKLGRRLVGDETCDHIDGNRTNDHPDNLQVLSQSENRRKDAVKLKKYASKYTKVNCLQCDKEFMKYTAQVAHYPNSFCSHSCRTIYRHRVNRLNQTSRNL